MVTISNQWTGSYSRDPVVAVQGAPPQTPLAVSISNTSGRWLFAFVSWRQDAAPSAPTAATTSATVTYPSSVTVSDDGNNFWIPAGASSSSGVTRCAVWMAPAARTANWVYVSPDNYQSALTVLIAEMNGTDVPWYSLASTGSSFATQATATSVTQQPAGFGTSATGGNGGAAAAGSNGFAPGGGGGGGASNNAGGSGGAGQVAIIVPNEPQLTQVFNTTGSWRCPTGVTSVQVICWGGGGGADDGATSGGGGGGECASEPALAVTPGRAYSFTVGGGGVGASTINAGGGAGGTSSFPGDSVTVTAHGGSGVAGGSGTGAAGGTGSANTIHFNGGAGGNGGVNGGVNTGGGGGGSAGTTGAGSTGTNGASGGAGGAGGAGLSQPWLTVGVVSYDNSAMPATIQGAGNWTALSSVTTNNGTDHTGDMLQFAYYGSGQQPLTLGAFRNSGGNVADLAVTVIQVHGPVDAIPFPYALQLENWPVLVTEIAAGPAINADPVFAQGATFWTGASATVAAATWPLYNPWPDYGTYLSGSVKVTPSGSATTAKVSSEVETLPSTVTSYTAVAWVYTPTGFPNISIAIDWFTPAFNYANSSKVASFSVPAGAWTQLTVGPVVPPGNLNVGAAAVSVTEISGSNIPSSAVFYVGYAAFGLADTYQNTETDLVAWTDVSALNFSHDAITINRGIQYEQQSLEAGTMSVSLDNNNGNLTFGNILSPFWPNIGDTDVPIRLRAIWPQSLTPYYVLFSGFTDNVQFRWDDATRYGFSSVESSDAWSRLTAQMLGAAEEEVTYDNPAAYIPCNGNGTNQAVNGTGSAVTLTSTLGAGTQVASFTSSAISLAGDQGVSCWQSTGISNVFLDPLGVALAFYPPSPYIITGGITLEFWMSPQSVSAAQPTFANLVVATAFTAKGPAWSITINNLSGGTPSQATITTYDQTTGTGTTSAAFGPNFLTSTGAAGDWFFAVTWNQTSLSLVMNPGGGNQVSVGPISVNFGASVIGFTFGGNIGPNVSGSAIASIGFMNIAIYGIAVFTYLVPPARIAAHFSSALTGNPLEIDTWRLARITGYAGGPVTFAARGLDLATTAGLPQPAGLPATADLDLMTAATDTNSQVASAYYTNVASSTLAFMYVNGPGMLIYRRRLECYDQPNGQWVLGEDDPEALSLNVNSLSAAPSTAGWVAQNSATLTTGSLTGLGPQFFPYCGIFHGNGIAASPQIAFGALASTPVTPGQWYQGSAWIASPQGWSSGGNGVLASIVWRTSGGTLVSTSPGPELSLAAEGVAWVTAGPVQAPATAAFAQLVIIASGTPPSSALFYVGEALLSQVNATPAAGVGFAALESPYLIDVQLSSDRAQLYNQAILTQYGTNLIEKFTGTDVTFTPSSGVIVTITNQASVSLRGAIPYQVSVYLDNTAQATPYYLNDPSVEDFGNWITQTLAAPLLRPDKIAITPAATPFAMQMALGAEVGDTVTFRRRPLGAQEVQIVGYISKITHDIDIATDRWTTEYQLSPFPQGSVLACDDVIHGTLTGGNYFGW